MSMRVLLVLCLLLGGCHGTLVKTLEQRQIASCIYWSSPFGHGVTSTGGVPLSACLSVACPCALR